MSGRFGDNFGLSDRLRYYVWQYTGARYTFDGSFKNGPRISIRPRTLHPSDYNTVYTVFRIGDYETDLAPASVRRIVDLGGNVGYTCLFWCWRYPNAKVLTFEPHPVHCKLLKWHSRVNNYGDRIQLIPAGAAPSPGKAVLTDDGERSRVLGGASSQSSAPRTVEIELVDFFKSVGSEPIDILKMDIEGAEYPLLADPRFDEVARRTRCIVMEFHLYEPSHPGGQWCVDRLEKLGFSVRQWPASSDDAGMVIGLAPGYNSNSTP